jgi:hypothetical protein
VHHIPPPHHESSLRYFLHGGIQKNGAKIPFRIFARTPLSAVAGLLQFVIAGYCGTS